MRTIKFRVTEKSDAVFYYDISEAFKLAAKVQQLVGYDANGNEVYEGCDLFNVEKTLRLRN